MAAAVVVLAVVVVGLALSVVSYNGLVRRRDQVDSAWSGAHGPVQQGPAESALTGALKSLFAVVESYPDLRASQGFIELQQELSATEDRAAYARQYYNDAVLTYNNAVTAAPRRILAAVFKLRPREYFQAVGEELGPVRV